MKKNLLHLLVASCALILPGLTATAQWQHVGAPNFAAGAVKYTSMVLAKDTPVVAFRDNSAGGAGKVTVMRYDGNGWGSVGNTGFTTNRIKDVSLAADSATGHLYVAYIDSIDGIHVDQYDGTTWSNVGGTGFVSNVQADEIKMLVAGDGTPYIGYLDANHSYKANMMKYAGGSWQQVGLANFSTQSSTWVDFAIDHYGTPYAVSEYTANPELIEVSKFDGSSWAAVGTVGFDTASYATQVALAIGPNNQPYVAVSYHNNHYPIKVWTYNGAWSLIGGQAATAAYAADVDLAVNSLNLPVISYADYNGSYQQSVKYYNGSAWIQLGSADFTSGEADFGSLAINSRNDVYLAYEDYSNSYGATVDVYLHNVGVHEVAGLKSFTLYPNPSKGKYRISYQPEQTGAVSLMVSDMTGRTVLQKTMSDSNGTEEIDLTGMVSGVYALQVKTATGMETRLLELQ